MKFNRPIGAKADVAELRYVSALLQTCPELREDGSIHQADIDALIASKYSLKLPDDEVQASIMNGMGTGGKLTRDIDGDAKNEMIDMCEVVAALIIPELIKAAKHNNQEDMASEEGTSSDMLNIVLGILEAKHGQDLILSHDIMKKILVELGEVELAQNNDLVREMVRLAVQPNNKEQYANPNTLDAESFAHALTSDVHAYEEEECTGLLMTSEADGVFSSCKRQRLQVSDQDTETQSMGPDVANAEEGISVDGVEVEGETQDAGANHVHADDDKPGAKHIFSAKSIDYFTDDQASRLVAVALWLFLLLHILASGSLNLQDFPTFVPSDSDCEPSIGCDILEATLSWIDSILTLLIIGGIFTMGFGSLGNRAGAPQVAVVLSLIPIVYFFVKSFTNIGTAPGDLQGEPHRQFAIALSMVMAFVIILERMRQLAWRNFKEHLVSGSRLSQVVSCGFTGSENDRLEAASYKMNRMLHNACEITHENPNERHQNRVVTFYEKADAVEKVGGHLWVWTRMKDRTLYRQEGIRFSARLLAANIMQFFIILYIILFVMASTERVLEHYETSAVLVIIRSAQTTAEGMVDRLKNLGPVAASIIDIFYKSVFPALELLRQDACEALTYSNNGTLAKMPDICSSNSTYLSGIQAESEEFKSLIVSSLSTKIDPIKTFIKSAIDTGADILADTTVIADPIEPWMIQMAFGIGGLVAFFASIFIATTYLPSVVSTTLEFRSGLLPSLDDPKRFNSLYRHRMHHITLLTGAIFWGSLCYVAILSFVIALVILAVIWIGTIMRTINDTKVGIGGIIIGSVVTFLVQFIIFDLSACHMYNAFYRRRPGWANIHNLMWEAIWIGLSILFVAFRAIKLTVAAALQIGRIDIPFLADGVGVYGGFMLDRFPIIFQQDILAHEAHSHPFIERLGRLYLLKIRYGERFASTAGNCWRLVFVLTLFPWLKKYRVIQGPNLREQKVCLEHSSDRF